MTDKNPLAYTGRIAGGTKVQGDVQFNSAQFTVDDGEVSLLSVGGDGIESVITDSGTATPNESGQVNLLGGSNGIDVTASSNTITVAFDVTEQPTIPTSIVTDSGTATPAANSFSIVGDTSGIDTAGSSSTVTLSFDVTEQPTIPTTFNGDSGSATPSGNAFSILTGDNLSSAGSGNTVTISVNDANFLQRGVVELATAAEVTDGSSFLAISPSALLNAEGQVQSASVTLTSAQVKALRATPITLVSAKGSGTVILFLGAILRLTDGTEVFTEAGDNLAIRFENTTGPIVSETIEMTGFIDQLANMSTNAIPKADVIAAATAVDNLPLVLHNVGGSEIAGNASNDATLTVRVYYTFQTM